MPTFRMDLEITREGISALSTCKEDMRNSLSRLSTLMYVLQQSWLGSASNGYFNDYNDWRAQANQLIEQLETLQNRLKDELEKWEQAANF